MNVLNIRQSKEVQRQEMGRAVRIKGRWLSLLTVLMILLAPFATASGAVQAEKLVVDLSGSHQNPVILGTQENEYLGVIIGSADYNGDNFADLLMGAAGNDHNGPLSGAVYMVLGGPTQPAVRDLAAEPANLTIYGPGENSILGRAVAAGDVNGDGLADMIIGAQGFGSDPGTVYVVLGHPTKYNSPNNVLDLANPDTPADLTITGALNGSRFGRAVAAGNVDGDGASLDDIVVGAYQAPPGEAGAVYLLLGNTEFGTTITQTNLLTDTAALTILGQSGNPAAAAASQALTARQELFAEEFLAPQAIGDRLGRSVAVGDVNNDGNADIIAGAYGANVSATAVDAGKAYVFFGEDTYADDEIDLSATPDAADATLTGIDAGDQAGFTVEVGDVNNNGFADVLIGAYLSQGYNNAQGANSGEAYVVEGQGLTGTKSLSEANATFYAAGAGDRLGRAIATGDVNNDGTTDLILGASWADPGGRLDAGEAYVFFGQNAHLGVVQLSVPGSADVVILGDQSNGANVDICENESGVPAGDCSDEVGHALGSGDIDNDGFSDVLAGALYLNSGSLQDTGGVYIIDGAELTEPSAPTSLVISPKTVTALAGNELVFTASASNDLGMLTDVTGLATFSIEAGAGATFSGNRITLNNAGGPWTVTASWNGLSDTAQVTITEHGEAVSLSILPEDVVAGVGEPIAFTAIARDANDVAWDATADTTFSIEAAANADVTGNQITPTQAGGPWTVTATMGDLTATTTLTAIEHEEPTSITVEPEDYTAQVGDVVTYQVMATDGAVSCDVRAGSTFTIDPDAGAAFVNNSFTPIQTGGPWIVTAEYGVLTDTTTLTVSGDASPTGNSLYFPLIFSRQE